jgi:hypothetical protein
VLIRKLKRLTMSDTQEVCTPEQLCGSSPGSAHIERTIKHGDTTYELFVGPCACGERPIFRLMRTCGASLSIYLISSEDYENLDEYVAELHASFTVDVDAKLFRLRETFTNSIQGVSLKLRAWTFFTFASSTRLG